MIKQPSLILTLATLCLLPLISSCSDQQNLSSLMQNLQEIRNRPSGKIPPLPEQPVYEAAHYTEADKRSPFRLREELELIRPYSSNQFRPDTQRTKEALEHFPLENLTFVGTLQFSDEKYPTALIDDGQGTVHKVIKGQYLGQDFGRVAEISKDTLLVEETVQDEQGGWIKRPRQLKLASLK